jgi:hypothetical protein
MGCFHCLKARPKLCFTMKVFAIILLLCLIAPVSRLGAAETGGKSYAGIYCLPAGEKPGKPVNLTSKLWQADYLTGVALRSVWSVVEKNKGEYNWSLFDQGLALARENNKKISLSVAAGGFAPDWVKTEGAASFDTIQQPNYTKQQEVTWVPVWDPVFQKEWAAFVQVMAARYDSDPRVGYVYIGGPGIYIESYVVQNQQDYEKFAAMGGLKKWIEGTEAVIDIYGAAFKKTPFFLALGNPLRVPSVHAEGEAAVEEVVRYGISKYPGRFGVASHSLNEKSATRGADFFTNRIIRESSATSPAGYQMVGPASGNFTWGNVGDLSTAFDGGIGLGARFIEVYAADCGNPGYASLLTTTNARLRH